MMNSETNLQEIRQNLYANGVTPKHIKLDPRPVKNDAWIKGNGPTPHCGLHGVNKTAGYNPHGNGAGKLA